MPSQKVLSVLADGPVVWAGTEKGLARIEGGKVKAVYGTAEGLAVPVVISLAADPATGDLWIGTMGGLARLSAGRLELFTQLDSGLANDVVYGVAVDGSDVWAATTAGLSRLDTRTGSWELFDNTNTLMHEPWCYAVTVESGTVYTAVWGGGVVVRDPQTRRFREHRHPTGLMELSLVRNDGLIHDVTTAIAKDSEALWVGTYFGLSRFDGRHWRNFTKADSGLAGDFINFLRAKRGAVWIATDEGVGRFDSKTWRAWRQKAEGGFELETTDEKGRKTVEPLAEGPTCNEIYGVDIDSKGDAWVATAAGLSHGRARGGRP